MGFENAANETRYNYDENKAMRQLTKKEEKSLDDRIQSSVDKISTISQSPIIMNVVKDIMLRQELSSNDLKRMATENEDSEELEKICDSNDPAVIIGAVQYYEVNKKELKLN